MSLDFRLNYLGGLDHGQDLVEDVLLRQRFKDPGHYEVLVVVTPGHVETDAQDRLRH